MSLSVDEAIRMVTVIRRNEIERARRDMGIFRRNLESIVVEQQKRLRDIALNATRPYAHLFTPPSPSKQPEPQRINRNPADPALHFILNPVRKYLSG